MKATTWALGNGTKVRFWLDPWVGMGSSLISMATLFIPYEKRFRSVSEYVSAQGQWRWECVAQWLPSSVIMKIMST